jgi:hypothetical protein
MEACFMSQSSRQQRSGVDQITSFVLGAALTEKVDCMTGPSIEESFIATGLQSFINMGALFASVVCIIHSNWDSCRGSKHTCSLSLVNCR